MNEKWLSHDFKINDDFELKKNITLPNKVSLNLNAYTIS